MNDILFYKMGTSQATEIVAQELHKLGYRFCDEANIQNATHILTDTPYSQQPLPANISKDIVVIGGNLALPYTCIDLLNDPKYLAHNAMITAHGAIKVAMRYVPSILPEQNILIIGWGRIGKCLAQLLRNFDCKVTVSARKESDRAILSGLGYPTISTDNLNLDPYDIAFNTVPQLLVENCNARCIVIDLASKPGILGEHVISARGLPGKEMPKSSGKLIAETIHRLLNKKE